MPLAPVGVRAQLSFGEACLEVGDATKDSKLRNLGVECLQVVVNYEPPPGTQGQELFRPAAMKILKAHGASLR